MINLSILITISSFLFLSCKGGSTQESGNDAKIEKRIFGSTPDGEEAHIFTMKNANGITVKITNYGGIITSLSIPGRDGEFGDVVLGYDNLDDYLKPHPYLGAIIGRFANRIADARFELNGVTYQLAANNRGNHLHGGLIGFDKRIWEYEVSLILIYFSPDGEEGYPGNLSAEVIYTLNNLDELIITYKASTDKATPVNFTHHGYFNLTGGSESILNHHLMINASHYLDVTESIPTGKILDVEGTAFDFRRMKQIGKDINDIDIGGYDHCYVFENNDELPQTAAILYEPNSGRQVELLTTQPGMQSFTGNSLGDNYKGKGGVIYNNYWGVCLENNIFRILPITHHSRILF